MRQFRDEGVLRALGSTCLIIELTQVVLHKADKPSLLADLLDAHLLACEGLTDIDFLGSQADAPAARDGDGAIMEGILQLR